MLLPYEVDVLLPRLPIANFVIIGLCFAIFGLESSEILSEEVLQNLVCDGWNPVGLIGYMFLHADFFHVLFNMLYLWIFGNLICSKLGALRYAVVYLILGVLSAIMHILVSPQSVIGASGAVNGIIGFYLVVTPLSRVTCAYWFFFRGGIVSIASYWIIAFWLSCDIFGALHGGGNTAYWAHLGGFFSGMGIGALFTGLDWITFETYDNKTLLQILFKKEPRLSVAVEEGASSGDAPVASGRVYYLHSNGQQLGPYAIPVIRQLLALHQVASTDLIYDDMAKAWVPISQYLMC